MQLAKFNLNQLLGGGKAEDGDGNGGNQEYKITHISVHDLEPSQGNFYSTEQIEELKASIAAFGIKQNLIVKPLEGGKYRVIAGHRRRLAVLSLVEEGKGEFEKVPCIIETGEDELRERLLLITTNSTARQLTDWEKIKQTEELRAILEQIKKRDKIPGRLRDLIASTLDTSPSQVARMEAITNNLSPAFQEELKAERVNLSTAYEISGLPEKKQQEVYEEYRERGSVSIKDIKAIKQESEAAELPEEEVESKETIQPDEDELIEEPEGHRMELGEFVTVEEEKPLQGSTIHELKTLPAYYRDVESGLKPFEVRINDRNFRVGDILHLREYTLSDGYTGRSCMKEITYILDDPQYVKEGVVIMGLRQTKGVHPLL